MIFLKALSTTFILLLITIQARANQVNQYEIGTPGFLLNACQDAVDKKYTFGMGYCVGVYTTVKRSRLSSIGVYGTTYCPSKNESPEINLLLIIKYLSEHPKTLAIGDDYYMVELALLDAWPCTK